MLSPFHFFIVPRVFISLNFRFRWVAQTARDRIRLQDYRTLLFSCIRLSITYCHRDFVIFFNLTVALISRKREFVQARFSSVTYGKHLLRDLEPKLWNNLTSRISNQPSLKQFKSFIRNQDLTALAANVSDCRGCNLCREWRIQIFIKVCMLKTPRIKLRSDMAI